MKLFTNNYPKVIDGCHITYLKYEYGIRRYLSTIKEDSTNEIVAHIVSDSPKVHIVKNTIKCLEENSKVKLYKNAFIHSDQGLHFKDEINIEKCKIVKELKVCVDEYIDYYNNYRY